MTADSRWRDGDEHDQVGKTGLYSCCTRRRYRWGNAGHDCRRDPPQDNERNHVRDDEKHDDANGGGGL